MCGGNLNRKLAREWIIKFIYQITINNEYENYNIFKFREYNDIANEEEDFFEKSVESILTNLDEIDKNIKNSLIGWQFDRLSTIDVAILRVATNEILFDESIPDKVSINEAVEIAKKYSTEDAYKFINGVLGTIARKNNNND